jgi:hypothetical protein
VSLEFFVDIIITELSTRSIYRGIKADNLNTFMCRLSGNSGSLKPLEPSGMSRCLQGLCYAFFFFYNDLCLQSSCLAAAVEYIRRGPLFQLWSDMSTLKFHFSHTYVQLPFTFTFKTHSHAHINILLAIYLQCLFIKQLYVSECVGSKASGLLRLV